MAATAKNTLEVIPGTEIIFDNQAQNGRGSGAAGGGKLFVFVFVSIMTPLAIAPMTMIFELEFGKTLPEVNMLFGAAAITLGYADFVIVPAANVWGRRPVVLVCVFADGWQELVTGYGSFIGARVIPGLGAAANESIMHMVIADMLFVHQRGRSMALTFLGLHILQAASFIPFLVAHPETKYEWTYLPSSPGATRVNIAADAGMRKAARRLRRAPNSLRKTRNR
ncbi:hypothetical protein DL771_005290 [Monosporascus sp. 5C6A]|nr:hypothetical protein DL771_005290 [Monosporascus sp. 5C6A]